MRGLALAAVLVVGLAACGSSQSATHTTSSTVAVTTATTALPAAGQPCGAGEMTAHISDAGDGAAATRYLTIEATNTGRVACVTGGAFGVFAYGIQGQAIASIAPRLAAATSQFSVAPGQSVTFRAGITDLPTGPQGTCPRLAKLGLTAPGGTGVISLVLLDAQGEGTQIVECPGNISVSAATRA